MIGFDIGECFGFFSASEGLFLVGEETEFEEVLFWGVNREGGEGWMFIVGHFGAQSVIVNIEYITKGGGREGRAKDGRQY